VSDKRITPAGLVEWLAGGERGVSSNTIVEHLTGWPALKGWSGDIPHDPDDLDRCLKLLAAVPLLRVMLPAMATHSPEWAAMVARWDEVEASHLDEVGLGWTKARSAPKTYAMMRQIIDAQRKTAKERA
jgi:hypothetical protein